MFIFLLFLQLHHDKLYAVVIGTDQGGAESLSPGERTVPLRAEDIDQGEETESSSLEERGSASEG